MQTWVTEGHKTVWNIRPDAAGHEKNERGGEGDDGGPPWPQPDLAETAAAAAGEEHALQERGNAVDAGGLGFAQPADSASQPVQTIQALQAVQHGHGTLAADATVTVTAAKTEATVGTMQS
jgi:hypothetical protein